MHKKINNSQIRLTLFTKSSEITNMDLFKKNLYSKYLILDACGVVPSRSVWLNSKLLFHYVKFHLNRLNYSDFFPFKFLVRSLYVWFLLKYILVRYSNQKILNCNKITIWYRYTYLLLENIVKVKYFFFWKYNIIVWPATGDDINANAINVVFYLKTTLHMMSEKYFYAILHLYT